MGNQFWPTPGSRSALQGVMPSSIVVGSGSAVFGVDGTITFTGASSISLNGIFDGLGADTYDIYVQLTTSASASVSTRLRSAGTDISSGVYGYVANFSTLAAGPTRDSNAAANQFMWWSPSSAGDWSIGGKAWIANPARPQVTSGGLSSARTGAGSRHQWIESSLVVTTAIYDGLTILASAGNMTGTIKVVKVA